MRNIFCGVILLLIAGSASAHETTLHFKLASNRDFWWEGTIHNFKKGTIDHGDEEIGRASIGDAINLDASPSIIIKPGMQFRFYAYFKIADISEDSFNRIAFRSGGYITSNHSISVRKENVASCGGNGNNRIREKRQRLISYYFPDQGISVSVATHSSAVTDCSPQSPTKVSTGWITILHVSGPGEIPFDMGFFLTPPK